MTQLAKIDKRDNSERYRVACDKTGMLITESTIRGDISIFISAQHIEQFLADCDEVVSQLAMGQKGAA